MKAIISSYSSEINHIAERDGKIWRTNCGIIIKSDNAGGYGSRECSRCGTDADFQRVRGETTQRRHDYDARHKQKQDAADVIEKERDEQRRVLAPAIQAALEFIGGAVEVKYFIAGAEMTGQFEVDGQIHKFKMQLTW